MNVSKVAKKGLLYTQTGTPYYASPEVWRDQPYDSKSDIWSLGCVLYESITLKPPFRADDMAGLYKKVLKGQYPKIPGHFSESLSKVLKELMNVQASLRPDCSQILEMASVRRMSDRLFGLSFTEEEGPAELLDTIRVPKNLLYLTAHLPKPKYNDPAYQKQSYKTQYQDSTPLKQLPPLPSQTPVGNSRKGELAAPAVHSELAIKNNREILKNNLNKNRDFEKSEMQKDAAPKPPVRPKTDMIVMTEPKQNTHKILDLEPPDEFIAPPTKIPGIKKNKLHRPLYQPPYKQDIKPVPNPLLHKYKQQPQLYQHYQSQG